MGTHDELTLFTHEELKRLNLTNQELCNLPLNRLIEAAQTELKRFKPKKRKIASLKNSVWCYFRSARSRLDS